MILTYIKGVGDLSESDENKKEENELTEAQSMDEGVLLMLK